MSVNSDFRDMLFELNAVDARFVVVGGYAVIYYAKPRFTKDLDIWVDATPANAALVHAALKSFGAPLAGLSIEDLSRPGITFQMGQPPNRIDILTSIESVVFEEAWRAKSEARFVDQRMWVLGRQHLVTNKRAVGREQDLADVRALERAP